MWSAALRVPSLAAGPMACCGNEKSKDALHRAGRHSLGGLRHIRNESVRATAHRSATIWRARAVGDPSVVPHVVGHHVVQEMTEIGENRVKCAVHYK